METKLSTIIAISALTLGLSACMMHDRSALNNAPGKYESTTESVDSNGTKTENESSTEVGVDENGNKTAVIKTKTTTDPEGLFNKTTDSQTKKVIQERY